MVKWFVLSTFFALLEIGGAMPERIAEKSDPSFHRNRRMINGTLMREGDAPWQVALRARIKRRWYFAGSGSIISPLWVVTAAHCVCNGTIPETTIRALSAGSTWAWGGSIHDIETIICHPSYRNTKSAFTIGYDIAVVKVQSPFRFDAATRPILLVNGSIIPSGNASIRGWGSTRPDGRGMSQQLRSITASILTEAECNSFLNVIDGRDDDHYGRLCATGLSKSYICYGDSGGPLVFDNKLIGIASWINGEICAATDDPAIFTSIFTFRDFIQNATGV